jgi:hypothetical protein
VVAAQKLAFVRLHGAPETGIVRFQKANLRQQQHAGVEIVDPEPGCDGAALLVSGAASPPDARREKIGSPSKRG